MALTDNLISYWKFDEASGNPADSAGSNNLTNNGSATYSSGLVNNAINLAVGKYASISNASQTGLNLSGDFSFSLWLNLSSVGNYIALITKLNAAGTAIQYWLYSDTDKKIYMDISQDGSQTASKYHRQGTTAVQINNINTWYHIVVTFVLSTNTVVMYVNGSSVASSQVYGSGLTSIFSGPADFDIGYDNGLNGNGYIRGQVDEVGIWSRAISSAEVSTLYNGGGGLSYPFTASSVRRLALLGVG